MAEMEMRLTRLAARKRQLEEQEADAITDVDSEGREGEDGDENKDKTIACQSLDLSMAQQLAKTHPYMPKVTIEKEKVSAEQQLHDESILPDSESTRVDADLDVGNMTLKTPIPIPYGQFNEHVRKRIIKHDDLLKLPRDERFRLLSEMSRKQRDNFFHTTYIRRYQQSCHSKGTVEELTAFKEKVRRFEQNALREARADVTRATMKYVEEVNSDDEVVTFDQDKFKVAVDKSVKEVFSNIVVPSLDEHFKVMTSSVDHRVRSNLKKFVPKASSQQEVVPEVAPKVVSESTEKVVAVPLTRPKPSFKMTFGEGKVTTVQVTSQTSSKTCDPLKSKKQHEEPLHHIKSPGITKKKNEAAKSISKEKVKLIAKNKKKTDDTVNSSNVESYLPKLSKFLEILTSSFFNPATPHKFITSIIPRASYGKLCKEPPTQSSLLTKKEIELAKKLWVEAIKSGFNPSVLKTNYRQLMKFKFGDSYRAQCFNPQNLVFPPPEYEPQGTSVVKHVEDMCVRMSNESTTFSEKWDTIREQYPSRLKEFKILPTAANDGAPTCCRCNFCSRNKNLDPSQAYYNTKLEEVAHRYNEDYAHKLVEGLIINFLS